MIKGIKWTDSYKSMDVGASFHVAMELELSARKTASRLKKQGYEFKVTKRDREDILITRIK